MLAVLAHSMEEKQASLSGSIGRSYAPLKLLKKQDTIVREALQRLDGAAQHFPRAALSDSAANLRAWFATRGALAAEECIKELLCGPAEDDAALARGEERAISSVRGIASEWFSAAVLAEQSLLVEELLAGVTGGLRARMPEVWARNAEKVAAVDEHIKSSVAMFGAELDRHPVYDPSETARLSEAEIEATMRGFRKVVAIEARCGELRVTLGRTAAAFLEGRIRTWARQGVERATAALDAEVAALPVMTKAEFSAALGKMLSASVGRFEKELEAARVSGVVANESVVALAGALEVRVVGHEEERNRKVPSIRLYPHDWGVHSHSGGCSSLDQRFVAIGMGSDMTLMQGKFLPMHSPVSI